MWFAKKLMIIFSKNNMPSIGLKKIIFGLLLIACIVTFIPFHVQILDLLKDEIQASGAWEVVIFVLASTILTILMVPGFFMPLIGGALFGPVAGFSYSLIGGTLGATVSFLLARYLLSDWFLKRMGGRLSRVVAGVEAEGWRFVAFIRLVPVIPSFIINYILGLTQIKVSHYTIASAVFMVPGFAAYSYLGYTSAEVARGAEGLVQKGFLALAFLTMIYYLPRLIKQYLKQR